MSTGSVVDRPPASIFFGVELAGDKAALDASFQEASGLSAETSLKEYAEGGVNQYKHRLPTYPKHGNLLLKRGLVVKELPLYAWCRTTLQDSSAKPMAQKKLTITAFTKPDFSGKVGEYVATVNPSIYQQIFGIAYDENGAIGGANTPLKFSRMPPQAIKFELLFNATGGADGMSKDVASEIQSVECH